jgi:ATP-binding cassette subfamily G (WHITE) protein 1
MAEGQTAYFGPAERATKHFAAQGFVCPKFANPADFLCKYIVHMTSPVTQRFIVDVCSIDGRSPELALSTTKNVRDLLAAYPNSEEGMEQKRLIEEEMRYEDPNFAMEVPKGYPTSFPYQLRILLERSGKNVYRDRFLNSVRLFQTVFFAVLIGLIYLRVGNDQLSIQNRAGVLFFVLINQAFTGMFNMLNSFPGVKQVFMRERAGRYYRVSSFYVSKIVSELPSQIFFPLIFSVIVYWMIGLNSSPISKFFLFLLIIELATLCASAMGLAISAGAPTIEIGKYIILM